MNYSSKINDGNMFEKGNSTTAIAYILYIKEIYFKVYTSNINSNYEKQNILLMVPKNKKGWHYLAVKKLSKLLKTKINKE